MPYATRDDVFNLALSARAFAVRPMVVEQAGVDIATGVIRLRAHGLSAEDVVTIEAPSGTTLPTGLAAGTTYGIESVGFDLLRLTSGGVPITSYASAGQGDWGVLVDQMRRLDAHLEAASARIDEHLTAHSPPLETPYPVQVVEVCARLAARRMLVSLQYDNAAFRVAVEQLRETSDQDEAQLQRWMSGKPVHPRPTDQTTTPDNGARASRSRSPSNWTTGRL